MKIITSRPQVWFNAKRQLETPTREPTPKEKTLASEIKTVSVVYTCVKGGVDVLSQSKEFGVYKVSNV